MRILLATPLPPSPRAPGAIPIVLHAQLVGLAERHDVTLVTAGGPDPGELAALDRLEREGFEVHAVRRRERTGLALVERRVRRAHGWLVARRPWRTVWFHEPRVQRLLDRLLADRCFDLVAAEDNAMAVYRYPTSAPVVLTEHEVRRPRPFDRRRATSARSLLAELDWQRWPRYERSVWRRFDRLHVFSSRDAASVAALAPELSKRIRVTPFGIELPELRPEPEEPGAVVFIGNFTHPPNTDAALWLGHEIMPRLRKLAPGTRLLLAGAAAPHVVRRLAADDVLVLDEVEDADALVARATLLLAPLRTGGGMRMKVLHAMALGKAVVTTSRGAEGFQPGAPLAVADDADGLAARAAALLASPEERRELGRRARAYVEENHSPAAYARRLEASYAELVETPEASRAEAIAATP